MGTDRDLRADHAAAPDDIDFVGMALREFDYDRVDRIDRKMHRLDRFIARSEHIRFFVIVYVQKR
jgi:hypothetical protein